MRLVEFKKKKVDNFIRFLHNHFAIAFRILTQASDLISIIVYYA